MSEWEDKLNTLLNDPDAMAQVMGMAQSLSQQLGGQNDSAASDGNTGKTASAGRAGEEPAPDLASLLAGIDPALLRKLPPLLAMLNRPESGETAALLRALRPFLKPERQEKLDRAAQLARLIHLGKAFLLGQEGETHV